MQTISKKIEDKQAHVGVIGLGYVGLPLVKAFCLKGYPVTGFDVDDQKIEMLLAGKSYIKHFDISELEKSSFTPTSDFARLADMDAIIICVPTPLTKHRNPDLTYVNQTCRTIARFLRKDQLIILESTTYPGTTQEVVIPLLEENSNHFKTGTDFYVAFSPEREDPGNRDFEIGTIPKVVGGNTTESTELACRLYGSVVKKTIPVSSTSVAEASKILENIYRAVNIALVNELKILFDKMGIDIWEVIQTSSTKPFGFHPFYPGPGLGGHCIPIDPFYLAWKAKEYGLNTKFIELAGEINTAMPNYVCHRTMEAINQIGKSIKGAKILILGIAYKKNIDDIRESPSLEIIEILENMGADITYFDPYVEKIVSGRHPNICLDSLTQEQACKSAFDAALILTAHDNVDYKAVLKHIDLVVDTRNALKNIELPGTKIIKA